MSIDWPLITIGHKNFWKIKEKVDLSIQKEENVQLTRKGTAKNEGYQTPTPEGYQTFRPLPRQNDKKQ